MRTDTLLAAACRITLVSASYHSIHRDRDRGRESTGHSRFERDAEAPVLSPEAVGKEFERGRQTQVIEDRRTQLMSHVPNLALDTSDQLPDSLQAERCDGQLTFQVVECKMDRCEQLSGVIVQSMGNAPGLLFQCLGQARQVGRAVECDLQPHAVARNHARPVRDFRGAGGNADTLRRGDLGSGAGYEGAVLPFHE